MSAVLGLILGLLIGICIGLPLGMWLWAKLDKFEKEDHE